MKKLVWTFLFLSLLATGCQNDNVGDEFKDIERQEDLPMDDLNDSKGDEIDVP